MQGSAKERSMVLLAAVAYFYFFWRGILQLVHKTEARTADAIGFRKLQLRRDADTASIYSIQRLISSGPVCVYACLPTLMSARILPAT